MGGGDTRTKVFLPLTKKSFFSPYTNLVFFFHTFLPLSFNLNGKYILKLREKKILVPILIFVNEWQGCIIPAVPRKGFGSANCDTTYTIYPSVHKQLIRTLFEAHVVVHLTLIKIIVKA